MFHSIRLQSGPGQDGPDSHVIRPDKRLYWFLRFRGKPGDVGDGVD